MIVVTGGAGFIGSNLITELNGKGIHDIVIVDRLGSDEKWRNIAKRRFYDIVYPDELEVFMRGVMKVDIVFHMGAISSTTATDADEVIGNNFRVSTRLWTWCTETKTPFIYASSAATYGNGKEGFDDLEAEEHFEKLRPLNLYGWSKHQFDKWAFTQHSQGNSPPFWAGLKFFNVFGPNEYHKGEMQSLISKNTLKIARGERIMLFKSHRSDYTDGGQKRDFIYVTDCTAVMLWLWEHRQSGLYNVGTGCSRSFHDLVMAIGKALEKPVQIEYQDMPSAIRANYQYFTEARMDKLRKRGFGRPFRSLEDAVFEYVSQYLTKSDKYR